MIEFGLGEELKEFEKRAIPSLLNLNVPLMQVAQCSLLIRLNLSIVRLNLDLFRLYLDSIFGFVRINLCYVRLNLG